MIQPETHPDAEILTAFAEQLVTETEREEILAHMAGCNRCRQVVFLAQQAIDAEKPAQSVGDTSDRKPFTSWFTAWRWSWIPVAALAGVVGFAVVRHMNRPSVSETRAALNAAPAQLPKGTASSKSVPSPNPPQQPAHAESKQKAAGPEFPNRDAGRDQKSLDKKDEYTAQKNERSKETDSLAAATSQDSASSINGSPEGRAKSSAIGGPIAQNQAQQQSYAQLQQNYANEDRQAKVLADSANKPASSAIRASAASQTVAVEAGGGPVPVSPAPLAAPMAPAVQTENESVAVSGKNLAKLKAEASALPSKLGVLSQAALGKRMIALDTAGSVFASDDAGSHWAPVKMQWTGRAVLLKATPVGQIAGNVLSQPVAQFELVTDKLEAWISTDGKSWTLKGIGSK